MKIPSITLLLILLLIMPLPATAQYESGYYCYQCPVCGTVFQLTAYEAANINPYTLCPVCGMAYAGNFIPVPCQAGTTYSATNSDTPDGSYQGSYQTDNTMGNQASSQPNNLAAKGKILMIVAPKDYQETELNIPRDYFRSNGYTVVVASKGVRTAISMGGETTPIDIDLKDIKVSDYSAIVFVGGEGIYNLKLNEDKDYTNVAKVAGSQKKLIGAICLGPWILADAGLLSGKRATAAETDYLKSKGAIIVEDSVVKDGNIITGSGPEASEDFAIAIIDALEGRSGS